MSQKNFVNPAFGEIFEGITDAMPRITFYGIIATYMITAALNVFFIPLPVYLSIPAALAIQFGRFAIVFMDFLNPTGKRSLWPPLIATFATVVAVTELAFSILHLDWIDNKFWAVFLFGALVICFGYLLEINFISRGAEAFGMTSGRKSNGAVTGEEKPKTQERKEEPAIPFFDLQPAALNGNGRH
jgi:hypothetical protein